MIGWQNFYYKNYAKGIALSLVIHLLFILLLILIPIKQEAPRDIFYFEEGPAQITLHQFDIENFLETNLIGGGSSGRRNDPSAQAFLHKNKFVGIPAVSGTPAEFESGIQPAASDDSISRQSGFGKGEGSGYGAGYGGGRGDVAGSGRGEGKVYSYLPFVPRQILEVLPDKSECGKGVIILVLHIGRSGEVKEHKVMMNSSGLNACLKKVIEAAYKSKWQPVKMEGDIIEYWVEKTYTFN